MDFNDSPITQIYTGLAGRIKFSNVTHASGKIVIELTNGAVWFDSSCTGGTVQVSGRGSVVNQGSVTVDTSVLSQPALTLDLHDEAFGKWVLYPTGKTMTLYRADGITVLKTFDLTDTTADVNPFLSRTPA